MTWHATLEDLYPSMNEEILELIDEVLEDIIIDG